MTELGQFGERIAAAGIEVHALGMRPGTPSPSGFLRLVKILRHLRPHLLHCWMYHANLLGLLAAKVSGVPHAIWSITCSNLDFNLYRPLTRRVMRLGAWLSSRVDVIVVNSKAGRKVHVAWGYDPSKMVVIPNGVDLGLFRSDASARGSVLEELGLEEGTRLIGLIARFDPIKDHQTFFKAANLIRQRQPRVHFLLAGSGISSQNPRLVQMACENGLDGVVHLLGQRADAPRLCSALDVSTLSSYASEGFPNVVGEAMACEVPCVVTDVGEAAYIVGTTGKVVAPRDPVAMANAWADLLAMSEDDRRALGRAARQRIAALFSLDDVTKQYEELYERVGGQA